MFSHRVEAHALRECFGKDILTGYMVTLKGVTPRLEQLLPDELYRYLVKSFGKISFSKNFLRKLKSLCYSKDLATIKRWWQTVDGLVYPLLLSVEDPDLHYAEIDHLIKFGLENCANNYAHFISRMKSLKRLLRKDYAEMKDSAKALTDVSTYRKIMMKFFPKDEANPHLTVQYLLCWTQTRASGLADRHMIRKSLDKCEATLSEVRRIARISTPETREYSYRGLPEGEPELPQDILNDIAWRVSDKVKGETAHLSAGPNACIESTRQTGGQTGYIKHLARMKDSLHTRYNFCTLEPEPITPSPVRSQNDLLSWAIQEALEHPTYVRCVRLHAVPEPSKARTITVCSLPYLLIVGVMAKLLQPAIASDISRGGLHASRNLWNFLFNDLDPSLDLWGYLRDDGDPKVPIMGLSSDLSEATDYGDIGVARQIFSRVLEKCSSVPCFPTALGNLAKTLFIGRRYCLRYHDGKGYRFFVKRNGWLMGDRITKVILTLAHEIVVRSSGLFCARICGDDVIAFSRRREDLERYLSEVTRLGFKVSWEDSYISSRLAFYCEEACIPLQRFREIPSVCTRRGDQSMYVDYPRIRLLIPTRVETQAYSFTDTGRFSLLGKESRWVHQNKLNSQTKLFHRASLLQHLHVSQSPDTLCPYLPIELGGDGAFPPSHTFLMEVVRAKARDLRETHFRMLQLLRSKWGFRFVRSMNLNDVVHKYHLLVPKIKELRELIPPESIIEGNELLLGSIKIAGVESPEKTFFRIWRAWYWHSILQTGREPPKLELGVSRHFPREETEVEMTEEHFHQFFHHWKDSGFTFRDTPDYLVDTRYIHVKDYMNMNWGFGIRPAWVSYRPTMEQVGGRMLLNETNMESFIDHIKDGRPLNPIVGRTLHKYVEADSYILSECARNWSRLNPPDMCVLVSGDKRLACELARIQRAYYVPERDIYDKVPWVMMVDPNHYLFGMMDPYEDYAEAYSSRFEVVVDFGAVAYSAYLTGGVDMFYENPRIDTKYLWNNPQLGVFEASLDEKSATSKELVSLTTQPRDQVLKRRIPWNFGSGLRGATMSP